MADPAVLTTIRRYFAALPGRGIHPAFGVLYGSHVEGRPHEYSDIDLVVVAAQFDGGISEEDFANLWRLTAHVDSRIEPIPCGLKEWEVGDDRAIIEIARRHGVRVDLQDAAA